MKRLLTFALLAFAPLASAQNAALMPMPRLTFLDSNGVPLAGGYLYTCVAGTSCTPALPGRPAVNPLATYTDSSAGVANSNPIVLDAAGRANVWLGSGTYKIVAQDQFGVTQWSQDNVSSFSLKSVTTSSGAVSNFNVPGTLTVGGTISGKLRDFASVMDFGAKGDGTSDDTASIQAGLTALASTCGTLVFPAGKTFLVGSNRGGTSLISYPPCVSMTGPGTIKVGNSLGVFDALFRSSGSTVGPAKITNLTIDMNGANNVISSDPVAASNRQTTFYLNTGGYDGGGSGLLFENNRFINGHGEWTIISNAPNVQVLNNLWDNWGVGTTVYFDASNLYLDGDGVTVANNVFNGVFSSEAHTAIEIHRSNKTVTGNVIKNFYNGIIYSSDQAGSGTSKNIVISNNTISRTSDGIEFWTDTGAIDGMVLSGNTITVDRNNTAFAPSGAEAGIYWYAVSHFPVADAAITGNTITFVGDSGTYSTQPLTSGISLAAASGTSLSSFTISGNTISNAPATGIYFSPAVSASNVSIMQNTIRNVGQKSTLPVAHRSGIFFGGVPLWYGSVISGNVFSDDQSTATMQAGIYWGGAAADKAGPQVKIAGNAIRYANVGSSIYYVISTSAPLFDLEVPGYSATPGLLLMSGFTTGNFPPRFATITDPLIGRVWRQHDNLNTSFFISQQTTDVQPTTGTYNSGDIVWSADTVNSGYVGWVCVTGGTPCASWTTIPTASGGTFTNTVTAGTAFKVGASTGVTATVACTAGQHLTGITIVGGVVTATPGCS